MISGFSSDPFPISPIANKSSRRKIFTVSVPMSPVYSVLVDFEISWDCSLMSGQLPLILKLSAEKYLQFRSLCLLFIFPIDCPLLATDQLSHARHFKRALSELHLTAFSMFSELFPTDFLP